jgi:hypothetical protein
MNPRRVMVLDAGALIHAEAHPHGKVMLACRRALRMDLQPLLPAVVFAQVWRGGPRQASVAAVGNMCLPVTFDDEMADDVGRLLAVSKTSDVVDAAVVLTAIAHEAVIVTSDPLDIRRLLEAASVRLPVVVV